MSPSSQFDHIPEHWEARRLKFVSRFGYGDSLPIEKRIDGEINVFGSNGTVGSHDFANTHTPMIVVGRKGSYGKITYSEKAGFVIDTAYYIDKRHTVCDLKWLSYMLGCLELDQGSKDSAVPGLSREEAYQKVCPFPPRDEQEKIANFLDEKTAHIDALIEKKQVLLDLLAEKRAVIIINAVTKGLNPDAPMKDSESDWLGDIPEHWDARSLQYICRMRSGSSIVSEEIEKNGLFPVYGGNGIRGYFDQYTNDGRYILIGRQGALCGNVHVAEGQFWASEHALVVYPTVPFSIEWAEHLLRAMNLRQYSVATAQPGLSVDNLGRLKIPFPPVLEQEQIANYIGEKESEIIPIVAKISEAIERLQEYRSAIITEAVTGKIKVA